MNIDSSKAYILIITVGSQDLKILQTPNNGKKLVQARFEADKKSAFTTKQIHQSILINGKADTSKAFLVNRASYNTITNNYEANSEVLGNTYYLKEFSGIENKCLHLDHERSSGESKLLLYPAKIADIIFGLKENNIKVSGAAIIHTARDGDGIFNSEPVASGPWILEFLKEELNIPDSSVTLINAIQDNGNFEGDTNDIDSFPVRTPVINWIQEGLEAFSKQLGNSSDHDTPIVIATGGLAVIKDVTRSLVPLFFSQQFRDLSLPEKFNFDDPLNNVDELLNNRSITRTESIESRSRALMLVRQGDFPGAWASVSQHVSSPPDQWWLQPLQYIALYFGSYSSHRLIKQHGDMPEIFKSLSISDKDSVIEQHRKFCLNAAFRAEASLQGQDEGARRYIEALNAICTLIDVATRTCALIYLDNNNKYERFLKLVEITKQKNVYLRKGDKSNPSKNLYLWLDPETQLIPPKDFNVKKNLYNPVLEDMQVSFKPIAELNKEIGKQIKNKDTNFSLRQLRNNATHKALSPKEVELIRDIGNERGIWRTNQALKPGTHCLPPPGNQGDSVWRGHIHNVLSCIDKESAMQDYQALMNSLIDTLTQLAPDNTNQLS